MDKESLHHKISKLQIHVRDFQHRISPGKKSLESQDRTVGRLHESMKMVAEAKMAIFLAFPFIIPAFVYSLEGNCPLFWQATAGSTLLISLMAFVYISYRFKDTMRNTLSGVQNNVKIVVQDADYMESRKKFQFTLCLTLLLLILSLNYWASINNMPTLFNICLVTSGFIGGILSLNAYAFWQKPKQLPYLSPNVHERKETKSSHVKRELKFCDTGIKCSPSPSPTHNYTSKKGSAFMEFQGLVPLPAP